MCENCKNKCGCHKKPLYETLSKEYLWNQLYDIEGERNQLLEICESLYNYFDSMPMLTEEQESYLEQLGKLIGR